jgi:hypothetical protein
MATALVSEFYLVSHSIATGSPRLRYVIMLMVPESPDPAKRFQIIQPEVDLDPNAPNQFVQQSRDAIIAAAAALQPPVTLNPADVVQGMYS